MEDNKKKVDESWKNNVDKEKDPVDTQKQEEQFKIPEVNFSFFMTTLAMQTSIALGDMPNPVTNKTDANLDQAKYLIDTLDMLKEKTKNNLSKEEDKLLENVLYELHMRYVTKKEGK